MPPRQPVQRQAKDAAAKVVGMQRRRGLLEQGGHHPFGEDELAAENGAESFSLIGRIAVRREEEIPLSNSETCNPDGPQVTWIFVGRKSRHDRAAIIYSTEGSCQNERTAIVCG